MNHNKKFMKINMKTKTFLSYFKSNPYIVKHKDKPVYLTVKATNSRKCLSGPNSV